MNKIREFFRKVWTAVLICIEAIKNIFVTSRKWFKTVWSRILKVKDWVRTDGLLHIETCFIIYVIMNALFTWWVALLMTVAAAVGKEIYDHVSGKGTAEWHDVICDAAGLLLAILVALIP